MVFHLNMIIDEEYESGYWFYPPPLEDIAHVVNFMTSKLKNNSIAVVQGPPGTRKTLSMFSSIEKVIENLDQNDLIIYIAPTNALVAQGVQYAVRALFRRGYDRKDIPKVLRVYGSQFKYAGEYLTLRDKVDKETKIVLTTPYQTPSIENKGIIHLMIDEASRMRLHEAFMAVRKEIINRVTKGESFEGSMIVVGDPMQAIVLPEDYREYTKLRKERLILESFIEGLLQARGISTKGSGSTELIRLAREHLRGEWYEFIDITYRLPSPTEQPISVGYYNRDLRAKFSFKEKIKQLGIDTGNSSKRFNDKLLDTLSEVVFDCLSTNRPILIIEPSSKDWLDESFGILNEPNRAQIAGALGIVLSSYGLRTTVVTAYRDQAFHTRISIEEKYRFGPKHEHGLRLEYINVHRMLGGESDAIVAVMGKEYKTPTTEIRTVYFQEPELLNVQLSRHKVFLAIIGDPRLLIRSAKDLDRHNRTQMYKPIIDTSEELLRMVGVEEKEIARARKEKYEGDAGIYIRWRG